MAERRVIIRHDDGREYSIERAAFGRDLGDPRGSYEEQGFEITGAENDAEASNAALEEQLKAEAREVEKATRAREREERAAARAKPETKADEPSAKE